MATLITQKKWNVLPPDPKRQRFLSEALGVHPIIAQLLLNRGIQDPLSAENFLSVLDQQLHDPFLLRDMDRAIERIRLAQRRGETVLIFGDYDVDGITALVVLRQVLNRFGIKTVNHIPDRMDDGYGLNSQVVDLARQCGAALVISVDCGITALKAAALLKSARIDLIIIDHHEPSEEGLPDGFAVIDPKRADCPYPFKDLAAVGLTAKLAQAFWGEVPDDILDLVALGTIADVVPLRGENRYFVKKGLPHIQATSNKGLQALMEIARIKGKPLKPYHAGFIIGPRINAAGRIDSARRSLDLLLSENEVEALQLACELDEINAQRQQLQRRVIQEALEMVERDVNFKDHRVIVLAKEGWHKGILGIVASKIVDTFYRPAIVASIADGIGTGSARSIEGFHLNEALAHCSDILDDFGGHKLAAGLSMSESKIDVFRERINRYAMNCMDPMDLIPSLTVDCEIPFAQMNEKLVETIDVLEPYGEGNRPPLFCSNGVIIKSRPSVLAKETLKFWVSDGKKTLSAVGFGMGKYQDYLRAGQRVDLAYELGIDDWNKAPVVQLRLRDIRVAPEE